jgi:hypothetical protein
LTDAYTWQVRVGDTWTLEYDDERPDGRGFAEIQGTIRCIDLLPTTGHSIVHSVLIPEDATPVFFRRRSIEIDPNDGGQEQSTAAHCIGWKRDDQAVYMFVFEDGSTLLTNDLQAV